MSNTPYDSSPGSKIADIRSSLRRLLALYVENAKLTAAEKLTLLLSGAVLFVIALVFITFALIFGAVAIYQLMALSMSPIVAAAILAGAFVLLVILAFLLRKPLIVDPMARFISRLIMDIGRTADKE